MSPENAKGFRLTLLLLVLGGICWAVVAPAFGKGEEAGWYRLLLIGSGLVFSPVILFLIFKVFRDIMNEGKPSPKSGKDLPAPMVALFLILACMGMFIFIKYLFLPL